jgi:predicted NAD-dependent protein-ADP-ribosyltransferase YbiA (DUF1768 family)
MSVPVIEFSYLSPPVRNGQAMVHVSTLSQLSNFPITSTSGEMFPSSEHFFQFLKFFYAGHPHKDATSFAKGFAEGGRWAKLPPIEAKHLGDQECENVDPFLWNVIRPKALDMVMRLRFEQDAAFRAVLFQCKDVYLLEASKGTAEERVRRNDVGRILMALARNAKKQ